ncbi:MAG: MerR family transcriptional regulator [Christensenellaceae bacterium]|nr:MerR family transcriptional regulator [Christensenellaceae bacterium]
MPDGLISIGRMAEINRMTVPTLRLYDKLGLVKPAWTDPETGYRYYDMGQNARLDMISYMKELGMSLDEIGSVLQKEDIVVVEEVLIRKNEQLHRQMQELKTRHNAVERAINSIERYRKSPANRTTSLEFIDRRRIWGIPCSRNFYATGLPDYEHVLAELRAAMIEQDVSQVHTYNVGTSITREDFLAQNFQAKDVFVFTDEHFILKQQTLLLDSGMYACLYLDNYDEEEQGARSLLQFCAEHRYTVAGDYICEVMTEFNVFESARRNMYMRLQVPVTF